MARFRGNKSQRALVLLNKSEASEVPMTGSFMGSLRERDTSANGGATILFRLHIFYSVNATLMSDSRPRFLHEPTWPFMNGYLMMACPVTVRPPLFFVLIPLTCT